MKLTEKTVLELREIAKKKGLKGYSKLCKDDLIKILKKEIKKGGDINKVEVCNYRKNINTCVTISIDTKLDKITNSCVSLIEGIINLEEYKKNMKEEEYRKKDCYKLYKYKFYPSNNYKRCMQFSSSRTYERELVDITKTISNLRTNLKDIILYIEKEGSNEQKQKFYDNLFNKINELKIYNNNISKEEFKKNLERMISMYLGNRFNLTIL